jgi:uncharacterized FlgJ-related protein
MLDPKFRKEKLKARKNILMKLPMNGLVKMNSKVEKRRELPIKKKLKKKLLQRRKKIKLPRRRRLKMMKILILPNILRTEKR